MDDSPQHPTDRLVAVLRTPQSAERVSGTLRDAGVPGDSITLGEGGQDVIAQRAEQRAELADAVVLPHAAFITDKEGARGVTLTFVLLAVVAVALAFPLALVDVGLTYWTRLLVAAGALLAMAFAIALVFGAAWGSTDTDAPTAAERGTVLHVATDTPEVRELLIAADPIRIDRVSADGEPLGTVFTESDRTDDELGEKVVETVEHMRESSHKPQ